MKNNALWHEVSEEEKSVIRKDIKRLLEEFAVKLESSKGLPKTAVKETGSPRVEGSPWKTDPNFRDHMFANAPFVQDNLIIAERGKWKKK